MSRTLNLGCGERIVKGAVNHDLHKHRPDINVTHDLNILPWPWADNTFDKVVSLAVFEHLDIDLVRSINECHRIIRPGGELTIKLPVQTGSNAYDDPTHRWFFTLKSLDYFVPGTKYGSDYGFYTSKKWAYLTQPFLNKSQTSMHAKMIAIK